MKRKRSLDRKMLTSNAKSFSEWRKLRKCAMLWFFVLNESSHTSHQFHSSSLCSFMSGASVSPQLWIRQERNQQLLSATDGNVSLKDNEKKISENQNEGWHNMALNNKTMKLTMLYEASYTLKSESHREGSFRMPLTTAHYIESLAVASLFKFALAWNHHVQASANTAKVILYKWNLS